MIRLLIILALAFGIYWCFNNLKMDFSMDSAVNAIKSEKTIKAVSQGRDRINTEVEGVEF